MLPVAGAALGGRAWFDVGRFLGPNISGHYRRFPVAATVAAWEAAGLTDVGMRRMSLGGGLVMWGRRPGDRRRHRNQPAVSDDARPLPPAFYAARQGGPRRAWADWWIVLHPPYTLWHLSYVAIGATLAPHFDGGRFAATIVAFFLAVGVCAHALDELHGRPLRTAIPSLAPRRRCRNEPDRRRRPRHRRARSCRTGPGRFIVVGVLLDVGYNLEVFGGRLHNDVTFAAAWGAFPVLAAYYAQAETLRLPALAAAAGAYALSRAQRSLSTPARTLRRRVATVEGTVTHADGRTTPLSAAVLLAPLEAALKATAWGSWHWPQPSSSSA